jgi:hypothetical protein
MGSILYNLLMNEKTNLADILEALSDMALMASAWAVWKERRRSRLGGRSTYFRVGGLEMFMEVRPVQFLGEGWSYDKREGELEIWVWRLFLSFSWNSPKTPAHPVVFPGIWGGEGSLDGITPDDEDAPLYRGVA